MLIGGESGVGKSRLLAEFERLAHPAEARFLTGACVDVGGSELPYSPIVAALRPLGRETDSQALSELVGPGSAELAPLLPDAAVAGHRRGTGRPDGAVAALRGAARPARRRLGGSAGRARGRGHPLGGPIDAEPARLPRAQRANGAAAARRDLPERRAPPPSSAAPAPGGRGAYARGGAHSSSQRFTAPRARRAASGHPRCARRATARATSSYERSQGNAFFAEELLAAPNGRAAGGLPTLRDVLTLR